jgi:DNA-binding transcriptional regulator YiaG
MALTQEQLAEALGVRQQTISEWETAVYRPRGASERLLTIVADDAGYTYVTDITADGSEEAP